MTPMEAHFGLVRGSYDSAAVKAAIVRLRALWIRLSDEGMRDEVVFANLSAEFQTDFRQAIEAMSIELDSGAAALGEGTAKKRLTTKEVTTDAERDRFAAPALFSWITIALCVGSTAAFVALRRTRADDDQASEEGPIDGPWPIDSC
jgi:hypothetical protein